MKRIVCMLAVLLVCLHLGSPVMAASNTFVPSITYKDGPEITDAVLDGQDAGNCVVVSSIKDAKKQTTDIYQEDRDLLLEAYAKLADDSMKLPLENKQYVVRELVDVSWEEIDCVEEDHTHEEDLNREGVTVTIDFDLGVDANTEVLVYVYHDGQWQPVKGVTNNGDGTVTCAFEDIGAVAFVVRQQTGGAETGDVAGRNLVWWGVLMAVSVVAIVVLTVRRKKHDR